MANILPDNETITFEDQLYVNPEASLKEQNAFIDNLRGLQNQNNAEINTQTTNLGTYPASQSNLGGLIGGEGYFTARYQTPQGVSLAANLDAVTRAQAQNEVLNNQLSALKQRYNKAYKAAQKRAANSGGPGINDTPEIKGGTKETSNSNDILTAQGIGGISRPTNIAGVAGAVANAVAKSKGGLTATYTTTVGDDGHSYTTLNGKLVDTSNPNYRRANNGQMYNVGRNGTTEQANNLAQLEKIRKYSGSK